MADSTQMEQILMNLATNARDAMPRGGSIMIETKVFDLEESFITSHGYGEEGTYACIVVTDTGVGMDEKTRARAFEPFFTTKEVGKGTGLGLSIIYGIVKQHNGYINIYSEPGHGTTFRIYLPLLRFGRGATITAAAGPPQGGTETIILAEDDPEIREVTTSLLREFGYTVIPAVDGLDAIEQFTHNGERADLLVLDVVMPRKNGREVYEEVKRMKREVKVLFTSGYPSDIMHRRDIVRSGLEFISKPVTPQKLLRKIREVLDT
jgi:CheY-like chemotaxis protein